MEKTSEKPDEKNKPGRLYWSRVLPSLDGDYAFREPFGEGKTIPVCVRVAGPFVEWASGGRGALAQMSGEWLGPLPK